MTERPILFSAPMVRRLLAGEKTQTRRVLKQPKRKDGAKLLPELLQSMGVGHASPYGVPGDRLWVRETWGTVSGAGIRVVYRADGDPIDRFLGTPIENMKWVPSIHMFRSDSRIDLEITGVRVERLNDISKADAMAEGARRFDDLPSTHPYGGDARWSMESPTATDHCLGSAQMAFANLWININGPDSWGANPWVWVVEFKRVRP